MALLTPEDLANMKNGLVESDRMVSELTGSTLDELCRLIYGTNKKNEKIGIVPITAGCGIIGSFSESLLFTVQHFGMNGFITQNTDVAGYYEAVMDGADIILMADDLAFIAHNLKNSKIAHNQICTGRIYAEILCHAKEQPQDNEILLIGLGKVGTPALETFLKANKKVYVWDVDSKRVDEIASKYPVFKYNAADKKSFFKIFEATPGCDTVPESSLKQKTIISTPGIPCCLSETLQKKYNIRIVQEPLGIGTLSMLYAVFDDLKK